MSNTLKLALGTFIVVAWLTCGTVLVHDNEMKKGLKEAEDIIRTKED